jgi:hypothetical protein
MTTVFGRRAFNSILAGSFLHGASALAADAPLAKPKGEVILSISGKIGITNAGGSAEFDREMLERLGMSSFTTSTPWYPKPVTFEGVLATKVMQAAGATGTTITALALNDYSTEVPIDDFSRYGVLFALKRDGAYMPVRDKGPIFIVYPYDSDADLRSRRYYSRSAWQVARVIVS